MANKWLAHMAAVRRKYPKLHFNEVARKAKETYQKQSGGSSPWPPVPVMMKGGSTLASSTFTPNPKFANMPPTDLDTVATLYSGGSKKSKKRRSSKRRGTKRRGTKRH